jgi:hypothetical protein
MSCALEVTTDPPVQGQRMFYSDVVLLIDERECRIQPYVFVARAVRFNEGFTQPYQTDFFCSVCHDADDYSAYRFCGDRCFQVGSLFYYYKKVQDLHALFFH